MAWIPSHFQSLEPAVTKARREEAHKTGGYDPVCIAGNERADCLSERGAKLHGVSKSTVRQDEERVALLRKVCILGGTATEKLLVLTHTSLNGERGTR